MKKFMKIALTLALSAMTTGCVVALGNTSKCERECCKKVVEKECCSSKK